jgi:hypothetical protein
MVDCTMHDTVIGLQDPHCGAGCSDQLRLCCLPPGLVCTSASCHDQQAEALCACVILWWARVKLELRTCMHYK